MKQTDYKFDGKVISYEILEDGYKIYLDGTEWIYQNEPLIPYPELGYEGSCLKQIAELCNPATPESGSTTPEEKIAALEEQVNLLTSALMEMSVDVYGE